MVDKSTNPLQTHFGPVFGAEEVQTRLPFSDWGGLRALLRVSSPIASQHDTAPVWLRGHSSGKRRQGARKHLARRPSSGSSADCHGCCPLPVALCQQLATSLVWLHERSSQRVVRARHPW